MILGEGSQTAFGVAKTEDASSAAKVDLLLSLPTRSYTGMLGVGACLLTV